MVVVPLGWNAPARVSRHKSNVYDGVNATTRHRQVHRDVITPIGKVVGQRVVYNLKRHLMHIKLHEGYLLSQPLLYYSGTCVVSLPHFEAAVLWGIGRRHVLDEILARDDDSSSISVWVQDHCRSRAALHCYLSLCLRGAYLQIAVRRTSLTFSESLPTGSADKVKPDISEP